MDEFIRDITGLVAQKVRKMAYKRVTPENQEFVKRVVFTTDRCSQGA